MFSDTLCGRTFTSSSGYIVRSSGKTNCSYNVIVPDGQKISVEVLELNMADDPDCKREQIEVRDGIHNSPFLARSCGNLKPEIVVSSSNQIQIRHTVFDEQKSSGFKLYWEVYKKRENTVIFDSGLMFFLFITDFEITLAYNILGISGIRMNSQDHSKITAKSPHMLFLYYAHYSCSRKPETTVKTCYWKCKEKYLFWREFSIDFRMVISPIRSQSAFICLKSTLKTPEQRVKAIQT